MRPRARLVDDDKLQAFVGARQPHLGGHAAGRRRLIGEDDHDLAPEHLRQGRLGCGDQRAFVGRLLHRAEHVLDRFNRREFAAEPQAIEQPSDLRVQPRHRHRDRQQQHRDEPGPRRAVGTDRIQRKVTASAPARIARLRSSSTPRLMTRS